jgi:hypothetical protein
MSFKEIEVFGAVVLGGDLSQEREALITDYMMMGGFAEAEALRAAEATLLEDIKQT